ncbi:MAG: hypothetical protein K2Q22_08755 [Cytophagales bacterium]|nr:hypothetical protein [Cytophagales bacterium]
MTFTTIGNVDEKYKCVFELLIKIAKEKDLKMKLERSIALESNKSYLVFDLNDYIEKINNLFKENRYFDIWEILFFNILTTDYPIYKIEHDVLKFFKNEIIPIIDASLSKDKLNNMSMFFRKLCDRLNSENMFEEVKMIEYYVSNGDRVRLYNIVDSGGTGLINAIAKSLPDYNSFISDFDPRM